MFSKGVLYMLISSISFALVNLCIKFLPDIPVNELVFFRSVISISICFYMIKRLGLPLFGNNKKWLLGRGIFGVSALTLFFFTLKGLPLASATTIQYLSPAFTVFFAIFIIGERVKAIQWLLFGIAFSGVWLIKQGGENDLQNDYIWMGVLSACLSGIAYNCIIKCKFTDHPVTVVMYFPLVAIPIMGVWCFFEWVTPVGYEWGLLLIIGILTQIAQVSMTKALHSANSGRIMPIKYVGAIWAIIIDLFILHESLEFVAYIGIGMVILGVLLNTWYTRKYVA